MAQSALGTATGLVGIPNLLISSLQQVQDPNVQTALREIQNWCNSVGSVTPAPAGTQTCTLGTASPSTFAAPAGWIPVSHAGTKGFIPFWI